MGAKKDHQGKAKLAQNFELSTIKLNNNEVEVIIILSQTKSNLSTKLL
jgi:hypothetical protein